MLWGTRSSRSFRLNLRRCGDTSISGSVAHSQKNSQRRPSPSLIGGGVISIRRAQFGRGCTGSARTSCVTIGDESGAGFALSPALARSRNARRTKRALSARTQSRRSAVLRPVWRNFELTTARFSYSMPGRTCPTRRSRRRLESRRALSSHGSTAHGRKWRTTSPPAGK